MGWFRTLALAAVAAAALTGAAAAQVTYNRGNDADPETLDPHKTATVYEANILRDLYEGLLIHDGAGKVAPGVAEKHEISDDGRVYRFTLRNNAKWSNGDPVKASDFVFSFRRIMDPNTGAKYANILYPILNAEKINKSQPGAKLEDLGVKAVDDRTVEITLERPTPYFLELLTHQSGTPVHPGTIQKHGANFTKPENMVSNGAYVLKEWVPNSHIRLQKNPQFHAAASVKIDVVRYEPTKDLSAAARRFMAGELQSTSDIPADQTKFLKEKLGEQVKISPYLGTWYLAVNTSKKPFDDVRVRQALSIAIDREFIAEEIWQGTMLPAYSFVPPGTGNYGQPATADYKDLSPIDREDKAKALLKEAGFGPGKPLKVELRYNTTDNNKNTAVAIANQWKAIGVETSFINTDAKTHFAYLRDGGDFDVARAGWIADYSDPQNFLFLVQSDNPGFNYAKYKNPDYDALMRKSGEEKDLDKRAAILLEAETVFMRDLPYIPILFYSNKNLVSSRLEGWVPNLRGANATRFLSLKP
ncbi:MAG: peptide ABC transporter substrate-binding protein [Microvirga sp.]